MKLRWTHRARQDLKEIGRFIAREDRVAARRFVSRLQARARRAARFPRSGRMVPEFKREDIREVMQGNYRVVYQLVRGSITVLAVMEGHRLFPRDLPEGP